MIIDLYLRGELVIIVGGGAEGLKKINSLLTQDCKILVLSDTINTQIKSYVEKKKIQFKKIRLADENFLSEYKPYIVMATTDDKELNRRIVEKARKLNCLAYAADDPEISDFAHPSVINIEDTIQVAISTRGRSPAIARKIKLEAEKIFKKIITKEDIYQIRLQEIARNEAKKIIPTQLERKKFLYTVINDSEIKQFIKQENFEKAKNKVKKMLRELK